MTPAQHRAWYSTHRDAEVRRSAAWRLANPEKYRQTLRRHTLKKQYGLTPEQHRRLVDAQQGVCGNPGCEQILAAGAKGQGGVDHSHETGAVRGILCHGCNVALGLLRDNEARIVGLVQYLKAPPAPAVLAS